MRLRPEWRALRSENLASEKSIPGLADLLTALGVKSARRLVTSVDLDRLLELEKHPADAPSPQNSLASYWRIDVSHRTDDDLSEIVEALRKLPEVEDAYLDIHVEPAAVNPTDDPLVATQGYLFPAPQGVDVAWAWAQAGGDGAGVGLVDLENGWNLTHNDIAPANPELIAGVNRVPASVPPKMSDPAFESWNHGTSSLGVVIARDNTEGVVGIAPAAGPIRVASVWDGSTPGHVVDALVVCMAKLSPGDVVMLELQTGRGNITGWPDNHPIEIKDAEREAIRLAVSAHNLVVVAAAGNAGANLDNYVSPQGSSKGKRVLNRSSPDFEDSGSIMVGASTAGTSHSRLPQSNFGSRVDCYAWGQNVATCGASKSPNFGIHQNQWYRTDFDGTSAATPIVTGVCILLQGIHKASTSVPLSGLQMRALMADPNNGTAPTPSIAAARIGVMPDLKKLTTALALTPDVFLRDGVGDDGAVPSTGALAASPDIIVRSASVADPQGEFGESSPNANRDDLDSVIAVGSNATVYLRCRNRGGGEAVGVVGQVWWSVPATLIAPDLWHPIGQTAPFNVAADQRLTVSPPITWTNAPEGHVCLVAAVGCARDPAPPFANSFLNLTEYESLIRTWNNLTWRNIVTVPAAPNVPIELPFKMVGDPQAPMPFDFELDLLTPPGTTIVLAVPPDIAKGLPIGPNFNPTPDSSVDHPAFELPHRSVLNLPDVTVPPGSGNDARLTVTLPASAPPEGRIILKQKRGGVEVGRLTWRLVDGGKIETG